MDDRENPQVELEVQPEADNAAERGRGRRRRAKAAATDASVNMGELREIIELIRENDFTEFELEREGFRVRFRRGVEPDTETSMSATQQAAAATSEANLAAEAASTPGSPSHPGAKAETAASEDLGLYIINSPIVGTFYRAASPNTDSFVKIGSRVETETVVCIIEAMKLMNEIQAETSGEVAKIYVENGQPVEYGQPLFGIKQ
ncbi:MAG TPA: acetyl-CoA carboxylase biotin carboxyl carrier protein [Pyrinomonadaceae bacterium]|nr:acetyl-CoA carboxylase biotin carboxyl carrier protein [Pyrinomonadaceae bacterium]